MKKYILTMVLLFFASTCFAGGMLWQGPRYQGVVASGSITAGNLLADLTSDNAFVAPVGVDLGAYQDGRHIFRAVDANGYAAIGFISSTPPSGETLGGELCTVWVNYSGYDTFASTGGDITSAINDGVDYAYARSSVSLIVNSLYKDTTTFTLNSGTAAIHFLGDSGGNSGPDFLPFTLEGSTTKFFTFKTTGYNCLFTRNDPPGATNFSCTFTLKQVTDPASTGARIVSTKGGATRAWTYKHASFNPKVACTYEVLFVGD